MKNDFIMKLEKKFGEYIFVSDDNNDDIDVISTGSLSLDVSTGVGGIPRGRTTVIYGPESSAKTTLCLEVTRNAISKGLDVLYIDVEQTLDFSYVRAIIGNFDMSKLVIAQPETAEEAMMIAETGINGDSKLDIPPGRFGLIVVDSVAALAPEQEKEKDLTDTNVALTSRLLSRFFRRMSHNIRTNKIAMIFVNQVRDQIGGYLSGYVFGGGHALKHYPSLIIYMSKGTEIKSGEEVIGINVKFVIKKNKLSPPFRSFVIPFTFGKGIDYYKDVLTFSEMLGVLTKRGPHIYFYDNGNDILLGKGYKNAADFLKTNEEVLDKIKKACYNGVNRFRKEQNEDEQKFINGESV